MIWGAGMDKKIIWGYVALFMAQLMVALAIVVSKILLATLPALLILCFRFAMASVFLAVLVLIFNRKKIKALKYLTKKDWAFIVAQGLCAGALFNLFFVLGLHYTSAGIAGVVASVLPAVISVFSFIFLKERMTRVALACIALAILGMLLVNAHGFRMQGAHALLGGLLVFMALIPEAAYYTMAKLHPCKLPVFIMSLIMNGVSFPIFFALIYFGPQLSLAGIGGEAVLLLAVSALSSALFYVFWSLGSRFVTGAGVALSAAWVPVNTLLLAALLLHEQASKMQLAGLVLVIFSIVVAALKQKPERTIPPSA